MSGAEQVKTAKKTVQNYAVALRQEKLPLAAVYLFGSYVWGKAHKWSDIDVAVVLERQMDWEKLVTLLWRVSRKIDNRIEPISFTKKDFQDRTDPMVREIRANGIKIT